MSEQRKSELRDQILLLRQELDALETVSEHHKAQKFLGRFWKYRNSYGGSNENEKWWLYIKPTSVSEGGGLHTFVFQVDYLGCIEIKPDDFRMANFDNYIEITETEFAEAWELVKAAVCAFA